jgi:hypothetical protein
LHTLCNGAGGFTFAFSVTDEASQLWDVYRFTKDGKPGTLAFRQTEDGKWIIGVMEAGTLSQQQVVNKLNALRN